MKKMLLFISAILVILSFSGCDKKEIPPGYNGKIVGKEGFQPELYQSSWVTVCSPLDFQCYNKLILLQTSEGQFQEKVTIRLKDNMNLIADYVRVRVKVNPDKKIKDSVFSLVPPDNNGVISLSKIYRTYGNLIVIRDIREVLSNYRIDDVRLNYSRITAEIYQKIKNDFKATPLVVLDFNLGRLNYPEVYDKAILLAKQRQLDIKRAQADAEIKLTKIQAKMKVAKAQYAIKMQEAKRISDYNKMLGNSVTPQLLKLRQLEVQQAMVDAIKGNQNVIYMPMEMMNGKTLLQIPTKK